MKITLSFMGIFYFKKVYFRLGFILFIYSGIYGQNQKLVDSLEIVYNGDFEEVNRLNILSQLSDKSIDPEKKLNYSIELIETASKLDSIQYLFNAYLNKGNAFQRKGNLSQALENYLISAKITDDKKTNREIGRINDAIAGTYSEMGNHNNSVHYYQIAINALKKNNDSVRFAASIENLGDEYLNVSKPDSALIYLNESGAIFKALNYELGIAYNLGNVGIAYAQQGKNDMAKNNMNKAIEILEKQNDYYPICVYLTYMSDIYVKQNDLPNAFNYALRSLDLAKKYGLKKQISDANLKLSKLYELNNNLPESFKYYKNYILYRDSVTNIKTVQQMANLRTDFEVQKKQDKIGFLEKEAEINQLKDKKNKTITYATAISSFLFLMIAIGIYRRYRFINKTNKIIQKETNKSEKLLLNILPEETAKELKQNGKVQAKQFGSVSVMFTDFKEFTNISQNLSPEELVKSVDYYFSKFDSIIEKHGLEKIKTIGDAYMCAGGLPFPTIDHADKMIQAAFEIADFMEISKKVNVENIKSFEVRIGINTGPVVAGVVGTKKFAYDIWGDTVNVASRMESTSLPGKINISETTYELIKDKYECEYRGEISVKNKGMMKMYFVQGQEIENDKTKLVKQKSEL